MNRFDQLDFLIERLGIVEATDAVVKAMSNDDFNELYEFIVTTYNLKENK